jgi:hypothetical protein
MINIEQHFQETGYQEDTQDKYCMLTLVYHHPQHNMTL